MTSIVTVACDSVRCKHDLAVTVEPSIMGDEHAVENRVLVAMSKAGWSVMTITNRDGVVTKNQCPKCMAYSQRRFQPKPAPETTPVIPTPPQVTGGALTIGTTKAARAPTGRKK